MIRKKGKFATKKAKPKNVVGYYNARSYSVDIDGREVYRAGNSKHDSQVYVTPSKGVGLNTMKKFCRQTAREIAKEEGGKYRGAEYEKTRD